ncbi:type II toxin-antitoxin system VapC family toxin [Saccharolobus islandicus]|uniref:type II toxin-antitoxin system VapC family toxin n=1 Tax=Saccharolobus islandicus TaxID=43080 RepID=UPI000AC91812|nr:PIN domain-containing protein [Sulfolobus islandicus]
MTSKGKYFDVNVFVYYLTGDRIYGERAKKWLSIKDDDKYTSIITPFLLIIVLSRILGKSIKDYNFIKTAITALESLGIGYLELPEWSKIVETLEIQYRYRRFYSRYNSVREWIRDCIERRRIKEES